MAWRGAGFLRRQKPNLANIETPELVEPPLLLPSLSRRRRRHMSPPRRPTDLHFICAHLALAAAAVQVTKRRGFARHYSGEKNRSSSFQYREQQLFGNPKGATRRCRERERERERERGRGRPDDDARARGSSPSRAICRSFFPYSLSSPSSLPPPQSTHHIHDTVPHLSQILYFPIVTIFLFVSAPTLWKWYQSLVMPLDSEWETSFPGTQKKGGSH